MMISLKTKTILIFTSITIILVLIMARVSYVTVKDNYLQQAGAHVKMLCSYMAASLDKSYLEFILQEKGEAKQEYNRFLKQQVLNSGIQNAFLFDKKFTILAFARDGISATQLQLNGDEIVAIDPGATEASFPFSDNAGNWYIWGFFRINDQYYLGIQESVKRLESLNQLSTLFWGIGIAGIILTVLAGWFIAHNISGPVDKLVEFSKKIGKGDFKARAPRKIYGEFKILNDTMEQMKDDLAKKNEEREQMLAQIAHEIRNPLGGIELLAGLVKEDLAQNNRSVKHLEKILEEVQSLKNQLTVFLEYSKPLKVKTKKIDVDIVLREIKQNFESKINEKNISFNMENNIPAIMFDEVHFKQVLNNLIKNSLDASKSGDTILLKSIQQNGDAIISVSDCGPGITSENEKNIFVPFFTTKANGTGLGLAVSKKLCRENNADLEFKNNETKGCTFSVKVHSKVV